MKMKNDPLKEPLHGIALYNPDLLSDIEFKNYFVARQDLLTRLTKALRKENSDSIGRHRLIIAQRGMGKTSMLRRIALAITEDEELESQWLPLRFPEEQWNLKSLGELWLNCLDGLADLLEKQDHFAEAEALDKVIDQLRELEEPELNEEALESLCEHCRKMNRRPLLLIDNIDLVFSRLDENEHWGLRKALSAPGAPLVFAASSRPLEVTYQYDEAFYDYFTIDELKPLNLQELEEMLHTLAEQLGKDDVMRLLQQEPGRITTLHQLTGGNLRTSLMLFDLLAQGPEGDVRNDLERLLDTVTPIYKARVDELPPQTQQVLDSLALNWYPIAAAPLAKKCKLKTNITSTQLNRLHEYGFIEKVSLPTTKKQGFQIAERFFNIWYLMRQSRRMRRNLGWLTRFLKTFYSRDELHDIGRSYISRTHSHNYNDPRMHAETLLAISEAIDTPSLQLALRHGAGDALHSACHASTRQLKKLLEASGIELEDIPETQRNVWDLEDAFNQIRKSRPDIPEEFCTLLSESLAFSISEKADMIKGLPELELKNIEGIIDILSSETKQYSELYGDQYAVTEIQNAIRTGKMVNLDDTNGAAALAHTGHPAPLVISWGEKFRSNSTDKQMQATQLLKALDAYSMSWGYAVLGEIYAELGDFELSEKITRKAIELDEQLTHPWSVLGNLFQYNLQRYSEAETAYLRAIELDKNNYYAWYGLGNLHQDYLHQYKDSETAYRNAIELDEEFSHAWFGLARLLQLHLKEYQEAERAYRKTIELDEKFAAAWFGLGSLLHRHIGHDEEAEEAFRHAINLEPHDAIPWKALGNLLSDNIDRYEEAETAFRKAIELDENDPDSWNGLGILLMKHPERYMEAEVAYLMSIGLDEKGLIPWYNLSCLYLDQKNDLEKAKEILNRAIEVAPDIPLLRIQQAAISLAQNNWGETASVLREILPPVADDIPMDHWDDIRRFFTRAANSRYLGDTIELLDELGLNQQWRPLYEALKAVEFGSEEYLLGVAPEVRTTAEIIYRQFSEE